MFFTKTKNLLLLAMMVVSTSIFAQVNTFTINSPASIEGELLFTLADFGDQSGAEITGDIVLADDILACDAVTNDLSGAIAMVDRGDCSFNLKAFNGEAAGALAVIICNNEPGLVGMPASEEMEAVTIACIMLSTDDCTTIKMALMDNAVNATLEDVPPPCGVTYDSTVVWGMNGEGEFNGGLGEWTTAGVTDDADLWRWDEDGVPDGCFCGSSMFIGSDSWCNGIAIFDADAYNNIDNPECDFNSPNILSFDHIGTLTSPTMDLTNADNPVIEFTQYLLALNTALFPALASNGAGIALSIDNGQTWIDTVEIVSPYACSQSVQFTPTTPEFKSYSVPALANQPEAKIQFIFANDWYFWMLDDVIVKTIEIADVQVMENWYSIAPNFRTPQDQVGSVPFMVDVENNGNIDITTVNLNATVTNSAGDVLYDENIDYETVEAQEDDWNRIFPNLFEMPEGVVDTYVGEYNLTSDNDLDDSNNIIQFGFEVTENVFSKVLPESEAGAAYLGDRAAPDQFFQSYGNYYYMPNGTGKFAHYIDFGVDIGDIAGTPGFIQVNLYQWLDLNDNMMCEGDERFELSSDVILVSEDLSAADLRNIRVPLTPTAGDDIPLSDDSHYLVMASMRPLVTGNTENQYRILAADTDLNTAFSYAPMNFAFLNGFETLRYGSFSGNGADDSTDDISNRLFSANNAWAVYMPLTIGDQPLSGVNDVIDLDVAISPNPATTDLFVKINDDLTSDVVRFELLTIDGKSMFNSIEKLSGQNARIDVSNIPSGMYVLNIQTEDGFTTRKVAIQQN